jgi:hypothetical protein
MDFGLPALAECSRQLRGEGGFFVDLAEEIAGRQHTETLLCAPMRSSIAAACRRHMARWSVVFARSCCPHPADGSAGITGVETTVVPLGLARQRLAVELTTVGLARLAGKRYARVAHRTYYS